MKKTKPKTNWLFLTDLWRNTELEEVIRKDLREISSICEALGKRERGRETEIKRGRWAQVMTVCIKFHMGIKRLEKY